MASTLKEAPAAQDALKIGDAGRNTKPAVAGVTPRKVWIDIDNSPHVPFFLPIIHELERHGVEVILTARDIYQVTDLLKFFGLPCRVIGRSYGKNKVLKVVGNSVRSLNCLSRRPTSDPILRSLTVHAHRFLCAN